jgi:hypothetical protein
MPGRIRNPFAFLFAKSKREQYLEQYVLREHARGRRLDDVLGDHYVLNRTSSAERVRLLDSPEIVAAVGRQATEELKRLTGQASARGVAEPRRRSTA